MVVFSSGNDDEEELKLAAGAPPELLVTDGRRPRTVRDVDTVEPIGPGEPNGKPPLLLAGLLV